MAFGTFTNVKLLAAALLFRNVWKPQWVIGLNSLSPVIICPLATQQSLTATSHKKKRYNKTDYFGLRKDTRKPTGEKKHVSSSSSNRLPISWVRTPCPVLWVFSVCKCPLAVWSETGLNAPLSPYINGNVHFEYPFSKHSPNKGRVLTLLVWTKEPREVGAGWLIEI